MKRFLPSMFLLLSACNLALPSAQDAATATQGAPAGSETTQQPATAESGGADILPLSAADPQTVALDFVASICEAQWSNSGEYLPCPGDASQLTAGYVRLVENSVVKEGFLVELPALLTIPAYEGPYAGIFGRYPPFTVWGGDRFRATLACQQNDSPCEVAFDLMYFDTQGALHQFPASYWSPIEVSTSKRSGFAFVDLPLDILEGQSVEFVLTVRDEPDGLPDHALWIQPYIWRSASSSPPPATSTLPPPLPTATSGPSSAPGVISGMVDMSSAPPYLHDPVAHPQGMPVVAMFFNLDDYTWWWIHTTLTHPDYQMTVPPGRYHVVAYAQGVGDVPYVTGAYTGMNPSCGQPLKEIVVPPGGHVSGIVISDWNWSCGGTAYRPAKPDEVPLP
jgi:hypothetical protein